MLLFHTILTFMKDIYQSENQVFNPTRLWYFYIVVWGKTGPAHSFPPPKSFDLSIDQLVFRFMLLFHCILTIMNDRFQRENQVFKPNVLFVLLHCGVGKDWAGPFFPPSLIFRSSIDHFVFRFMLLFHSILTFMKDIYQSENQVFNPTRLWYFYIVVWGKTGPAHSFPPPKCSDLSIYPLDFWIMLFFCCI